MYQLIFLFYLITSSTGQFRPDFKTVCEKEFVVEIPNGVIDEFHNLIYDNVKYPPEKHFIHENKQYGCVCDIQLCISKCCGVNHPLNITCDPGFTEHVKLNVYHDNWTVAEQKASHRTVYWNPCSEYFELDQEDVYHIKRDGILYLPSMEQEFEHTEYCVLQEDEINGEIRVQLCLNDKTSPPVDDKTEEFHKYGMMISIPFLFMTLLVYFILPEKKIQTKCLMAYVTMLMFSYISLVYLQVGSLGEPECAIVASCGVYFFMASFCWMNVTCGDMYCTFSGRRPLQQGKSTKWKRFGLYALFANGAPFILLGIIFGLNSLDRFKGHPGFAVGQCWLEAGLPQLLYFYGPMAILLTINTIFFVITAVKIRNTIVDNQRMLQGNESSRHCDANKQDFRLYIKLFIAMGINWIMEFISWMVDWTLGSNKIPAIWYPTDFCNAIYGLFIFIIFVCKKTIWIKLKQRYYIFMGKPNMARALSTRTSGYQMSQTERTNVEEYSVTK